MSTKRHFMRATIADTSMRNNVCIHPYECLADGFDEDGVANARCGNGNGVELDGERYEVTWCSERESWLGRDVRKECEERVED